MAKTRVSHLAKEFNLDVKDLILRLREINIEVENYLSSIEATDVARAREMLAKAVPLVEEQRVGSNVKRRRAMARPKPATEKAPAPARSPDEIPEAVSTPPEAGATASPPAEPTAAPGKHGPLVSPLKRRKVGEKPAKIIALPETPKPVPAAAKKRPAIKETAPPVEAGSEIQVPPAPILPETSEVQPEAAAAPPATPKEAPPQVSVSPEAEEMAAAPVAPATTPDVADVKTPDTSSALKRQKAKKAKKDTPARIISLPVPGEKPEPGPQAPTGHRRGQSQRRKTRRRSHSRKRRQESQGQEKTGQETGRHRR